MLKISRVALIAAALTAGSLPTHSFAQELSLDSPGDATSSEPGDTTSTAPNETGASFSVDIPTRISDRSSMDEAAPLALAVVVAAQGLAQRGDGLRRRVL